MPAPQEGRHDRLRSGHPQRHGGHRRRHHSCDVGIKDGVIATLGGNLAAGGREIDASGRLVLPGGIDSHCHIEQRSSAGVMCADDFYSATVAAAFGGTTTVMPFAAQHRGQSLRQVVAEYHEAAGPRRSSTTPFT